MVTPLYLSEYHCLLLECPLFLKNLNNTHYKKNAAFSFTHKKSLKSTHTY